MDFEYDPPKSIRNKQKHGIDFEAAKALWDDGELLIIPVRTTDETRYLAIGCIGNVHWSAVFTMRQETLRIISVRRSRVEEVALYEGA